MAGTAGAGRSEPGLLGIYLNDHLAGATAGLELFRRSAKAHRCSETGAMLERLAAEVAEDRQTFLDMMKALEIPVRRYKVFAGWLGEKAGRLKLNGHLLDRSPLSSVIELEALRLGVEGKAAGWRTLRTLASDPRLDPSRLDDLIGRALAQVDVLEQARVKAASEVFGGG